MLSRAAAAVQSPTAGIFRVMHAKCVLGSGCRAGICRYARSGQDIFDFGEADTAIRLRFREFVTQEVVLFVPGIVNHSEP